MFDRSVLMGAVVESIATELKVSPEVVRRARSLRGELRMDSIAAVNVAFVLEERFNVELDFAGGDSFESVEDIVAILERAVANA